MRTSAFVLFLGLVGQIEGAIVYYGTTGVFTQNFLHPNNSSGYQNPGVSFEAEALIFDANPNSLLLHIQTDHVQHLQFSAPSIGGTDGGSSGDFYIHYQVDLNFTLSLAASGLPNGEYWTTLETKTIEIQIISGFLQGTSPLHFPDEGLIYHDFSITPLSGTAFISNPSLMQDEMGKNLYSSDFSLSFEFGPTIIEGHRFYISGSNTEIGYLSISYVPEMKSPFLCLASAICLLLCRKAVL